MEVSKRSGITLLGFSTSHMLILHGTRCAGFQVVLTLYNIICVQLLWVPLKPKSLNYKLEQKQNWRCHLPFGSCYMSAISLITHREVPTCTGGSKWLMMRFLTGCVLLRNASRFLCLFFCVWLLNRCLHNKSKTAHWNFADWRHVWTHQTMLAYVCVSMFIELLGAAALIWHQQIILIARDYFKICFMSWWWADIVHDLLFVPTYCCSGRVGEWSCSSLFPCWHEHEVRLRDHTC